MYGCMYVYMYMFIVRMAFVQVLSLISQTREAMARDLILLF